MAKLSHAFTVHPIAHGLTHMQGRVTARMLGSIDGYRGIHAGVTKSGVNKGKFWLTRLSAADCSVVTAYDVTTST